MQLTKSRYNKGRNYVTKAQTDEMLKTQLFWIGFSVNQELRLISEKNLFYFYWCVQNNKKVVYQFDFEPAGSTHLNTVVSGTSGPGSGPWPHSSTVTDPT